jgi:integrase
MKITKESIDSLPIPLTGQAIYFDDDQAGFGVVVGHTGIKTFVFSGRVRGVKGNDGRDVKRRITIGQLGGRRDDGHPWTVRLARDAAKEYAAQLARGEDPNRDRKKSPEEKKSLGGPTLRDGVEAHLARMEKKGRADRTVGTFKHETGKYLAEWLDTPINDLDMEKIIESVKRGVSQRRGSVNGRGVTIANRVIAHVSASWNSLNKKLKGELGHWNPAKAVDKTKLRPSRKRVPDLADWYARVKTMRSPIRQDGLLLALYTGLRHEDVRTIRWDDVDLEQATLHRPDPKGGEEAAFTLPLSTSALEILKRRKKENARDVGQADGGWAFPGLNTKGEIGPIVDLRQLDANERRFPVEDVHALRREWESIAHEVGVSELDQHVLSNHSFSSHNVNATYIAQHIDHLRACANRIDAGVTERIKAKKQLKSVA